MTRFVFHGNLVHITSTVLTKLGWFLGWFFFFLFLVVLAFAGSSVAFVTSSLNISLFSLAPLKLYTQL